MAADPHAELVPILRWVMSGTLVSAPAVERKARMLLLDTLGCMLAGLEAPPVQALADALATTDPGGFRFPGRAGLAVSAAAQVGAIAATWDEACEGLARAHGRPGVPVIAAALPLAHARDATLGELLDAIVAGYEVGARMGEWLRIRPGMHVDAGWPAFGVAAAATRLLGGSPDDALDALETVACQVPFGLYAAARAGATARNTYLGNAARLGIAAAQSIAAGFSAPPDALAEHARIALDRAPDRFAPAGEFLILEGYLKPFAAVRHVHYAAAAALSIAPRLLTRLAQVRAIELEIYEEAITYCGNRAPQTPLAAQFSLSFGLAAALRFGELGPSVYRPPKFHEAGVRALEQRVTIKPAARAASGDRGATVRVELDGERLESSVDRVKGDPGDPLTEAECRAKFLDYAGAHAGLAEKVLGADPDAPVRDLY